MYKLIRERDVDYKVGFKRISEQIVLPGCNSNLDYISLFAHNLLAIYNEEQKWRLVDDNNIDVYSCKSPPHPGSIYNYFIKHLGYSIGFAKELMSALF